MSDDVLNKEAEEVSPQDVASEIGGTFEDVQDIIDEMRRIDEAPCTQYLSTGCTILDLAIADRLPGGFGVGRISHLFGEESAGKSVVIQEVLGSAQRQGGQAAFRDVERTLDFSRAKILFGLDVDDPKIWSYGCPEFIEEFFDDDLEKILAKRTSSSPMMAVGVDTLTMLSSKSEAKERLDKGKYGAARAKAIGNGLRKYHSKINKKNCTLILLDQIRENIGVMFGPAYVVPGGKAVPFWSSTRVLLETGSKIYNSKNLPIGVDIRFSVVKNKIAPPHRKGTFRIYYEYGIDDIETSLLWLKQFDDEEYKSHKEQLKIEKEQAKEQGKKVREAGTYSFGGHVMRSLTKMRDFIESNNLEADLRDRVELVWRQVFAISPRKPKVRIGN